MKKKGSITAFLSLILCSMLCFILSITELTRCYLVTVWTDRAVLHALDSVLAEYYGPLFQEYHLMALDGSYQTDSINEQMIREKLVSYLIPPLSPGEDVAINPYQDKSDLMNVERLLSTLCDISYLYDDDGEYVKEQAVQYMKVKGVTNILESLLSRISLMEPDEKAMDILEKKIDIDNELAKVDVRLINLIETLDGPKVSDNGIKVSKSGEMKVSDSFVKMFLPFEPEKEVVFISNDVIFRAVKPYYVNYNTLFQTQISESHSYLDMKQQYLAYEEEEKNLKEQEKELSEQVSTYQEQLNYLSEALNEALSGISGDESGGGSQASSISSSFSTQMSYVSSQLSRAGTELGKVKSRRNYLSTEINRLKNNMKATLERLQTTNESLKKQIKNVDKFIATSISNVKEIKACFRSAEDKIVQYDTSLEEAKDNLQEDLFTSLSEEIEEVKEQIGISQTEESKYDRMLTTLTNNQTIISNVKDKLVEVEFSPNSIAADISKLESVWNDMKDYSIQDLEIDYSKVNLKADTDAYDQFKNLLESLAGGITGLVMDTSTLSVREIDTSTAFSNTVYKVRNEQKESTFSDRTFSSSKSVNLSDSFDSARVYNEDLTEKGLTDEVIEKLIFTAYLDEHFVDYIENEDSLSKDIRVMSYEKEYLLRGNGMDQTNLSVVVNEVISIRFVSNLFTAISNTQLKEEAFALATTFFGWTGYPFLVKTVQYLILLVCTYMEALIDTSALMMGKEISVIKTKGEFLTSVADIYKFNYEYIHGKAEKLAEKAKGVGLTYSDYILFFLFCASDKKRCGRALDLMEQNIREQYDEKFHMKDCVIGLMVENEVEFKKKLALFPGLLPDIDTRKDRYSYENMMYYGY